MVPRVSRGVRHLCLPHAMGMLWYMACGSLRWDKIGCVQRKEHESSVVVDFLLHVWDVG